jgi:type II secretory pathway pseudopilin PulG
MNRRGFTLIETLLYTTIAASILFLASLFFSTILDARAKQFAIMEAEEQGSGALDQILHDIRNAESIVSPATSTAGTVLSLNMPGIADDPIVYDVSGGVLRVTRGTSSTLQLTNTRITVLDFTVSNFSRSGSHGSVQISFAIEYVNPSGRQSQAYRRRFVGSASIRLDT